jgi:hypothetical protein
MYGVQVVGKKIMIKLRRLKKCGAKNVRDEWLGASQLRTAGNVFS